MCPNCHSTRPPDAAGDLVRCPAANCRALHEAGDRFVRASDCRRAVDLLDKLDAYVGHVNCGVVHGAPECTCGFDDLYTQVRAVVRGGGR
jgi:hypothetical protein